MKKKIKQPTPKRGLIFTGWAIFNWGINLQTVFRTRKEAIKFCLETRQGCDKDRDWKEMSEYMKIVKVKVTII